MAALREFGFGTSDLTRELFLKSGKMTRMGNFPLRIEILTSISGVEFAECYANRIVDVIDGVEVSVINREHLKKNKLESGRHKDLDDLLHLK